MKVKTILKRSMNSRDFLYMNPGEMEYFSNFNKILGSKETLYFNNSDNKNDLFEEVLPVLYYTNISEFSIFSENYFEKWLTKKNIDCLLFFGSTNYSDNVFEVCEKNNVSCFYVGANKQEKFYEDLKQKSKNYFDGISFRNLFLIDSVSLNSKIFSFFMNQFSKLNHLNMTLNFAIFLDLYIVEDLNLYTFHTLNQNSDKNKFGEKNEMEILENNIYNMVEFRDIARVLKHVCYCKENDGKEILKFVSCYLNNRGFSKNFSKITLQKLLFEIRKTMEY